MITYKIAKNNEGINISVMRSDNWSIPFAPDNTDYQQFKKDLANGVELKDATGNVMTSQAVTEFLQGLQ
jgi:hypothetical protein